MLLQIQYGFFVTVFCAQLHVSDNSVKNIVTKRYTKNVWTSHIAQYAPSLSEVSYNNDDVPYEVLLMVSCTRCHPLVSAVVMMV